MLVSLEDGAKSVAPPPTSSGVPTPTKSQTAPPSLPNPTPTPKAPEPEPELTKLVEKAPVVEEPLPKMEDLEIKDEDEESEREEAPVSAPAPVAAVAASMSNEKEVEEVSSRRVSPSPFALSALTYRPARSAGSSDKPPPALRPSSGRRGLRSGGSRCRVSRNPLLSSTLPPYSSPSSPSFPLLLLPPSRSPPLHFSFAFAAVETMKANATRIAKELGAF